MRIVSEILW